MNIIAFSLEDETERRRYDELFERCPDAFIQQSTWWAEVIAPLGPDTPIFLLALDGDTPVAGLPLYLYRHNLGNVLISVPQAGPLGGVFCAPEMSAERAIACRLALLTEAVDRAQRHDCLALSLLTDPFHDRREEYQSAVAADYTFENFTQWIDLRTHFSPEGRVLLADYNRRSNLSRNLAKARAAGLRVRLSEDPGEQEKLYQVHLKRHAELGANPLDQRLLQNIARILVPRGKAFFLLVEAESQLASWGVYVHHRNVLDVLRLNMDSAFAASCPNFLNTDESLRIARSRGVIRYNWQSSPSRESGVYRYKQQWGSGESLYYYLTRLFCPPDRLAQLGVETLRGEYPLHFIIPYAAAENDFRPGFYRKT